MAVVRNQKVLLLIEPAVYVIDFLTVIGSATRTDVDAYFLSRDATQPWTLPPDGRGAYRFLPTGTLHACRRIWGILRGADVALLHTAGWSGVVILFSWAVAWWRGIPIYVEFDTGLHLPRPATSRILRRVVYPWLFRLPFRFLPAGERQRVFARHFGVEEARIRTHQMSIDVGRVSDAVDRLRRDSPRPEAARQTQFLFVGRLEPHKGLATLLAAFRSCLERGHHIELRIVGDGSMSREIRQISTELSSLRFEGRLEGDALLAAYAEADVFICPSLVEPWGLVVNEAMAAHLPVIATDRVGCVDDLVRHGDTGLVVPAGDASALCGAMLALDGDLPRARQMGEAGRRRIAEWTMDDQARIIQQAWTEAS